MDFNEVFRYDEGKLYWASPRSGVTVGDRAGTLTQFGYRVLVVNGRRHVEHHVVWAMHKGYLPKQLDHINSVRDDNRIENLRECTSMENNRNAKLRKDNSSGCKGICWHKRDKKWVARVKVNGANVSVGRFDDLAAAKCAVKKYRDSVHGNFARHG